MPRPDLAAPSIDCPTCPSRGARPKKHLRVQTHSFTDLPCRPLGLGAVSPPQGPSASTLQPSQQHRSHHPKPNSLVPPCIRCVRSGGVVASRNRSITPRVCARFAPQPRLLCRFMAPSGSDSTGRGNLPSHGLAGFRRPRRSACPTLYPAIIAIFPIKDPTVRLQHPGSPPTMERPWGARYATWRPAALTCAPQRRLQRN